MLSMGMKGTKWRIFTTATEMFAEKSYDTVSLRDIAKTVGIKASSIYNHFESKEELLSKILDYFEQYSTYCNPDIEELLMRIGEDHPDEILKEAVVDFEPAISGIMQNILTVAFTEMRHNPRSERLIYKLLIETPTFYMTTLLKRMVESKVIEPLDIELFTTIYSNLCYSSAARWGTIKSWEYKELTQFQDRLFSNFIKPFDSMQK